MRIMQIKEAVASNGGMTLMKLSTLIVSGFNPGKC
jgi:hypothetical protein